MTTLETATSESHILSEAGRGVTAYKHDSHNQAANVLRGLWSAARYKFPISY